MSVLDIIAEVLLMIARLEKAVCQWHFLYVFSYRKEETMCERLLPPKLTNIVSRTHVFAGHGCRGAAEQSLREDSAEREGRNGTLTLIAVISLTCLCHWT